MNFSSTETHTLLNPRLSPQHRDLLLETTKQIDLPAHVWLMSSGTESSDGTKTKMVALSKEAILSAAQGVVKQFELSATDRYLNALPLFHIGGVSVMARAHIAGFQVVPLTDPWSAQSFVNCVMANSITVTSLVPTQIYDLVSARLKAPQSLKYIFVGGGALTMSLWSQARALGWPLVLTYGMTETCAMVAFTSLPEQGFSRLPHIQSWQSDSQFRLQFLSQALLTGYLFVSQNGESHFVDPKEQGWYKSDDCGQIRNDHLFLQGRESELVKINGESVSLLEVQNLWETFLQKEEKPPSYIVALEEDRQGYSLAVATTFYISKEQLQEFNKGVLPYQRLQRAYQFRELPLSPLGKLLRHELLEQIKQVSPTASL